VPAPQIRSTILALHKLVCMYMYVCMYESDASPQNKEAHFTAIVDAECLAAADAAVAATVVCSLTLSSLSVLLCSDVVCTQSDAMPRSSQCARTTVYRFVFSRLETWSGNFISRILLLFLFFSSLSFSDPSLPCPVFSCVTFSCLASSRLANQSIIFVSCNFISVI